MIAHLDQFITTNGTEWLIDGEAVEWVSMGGVEMDPSDDFEHLHVQLALLNEEGIIEYA